MPSRSTATLGTTTTTPTAKTKTKTTTNAVRKTARTSAYFTRSKTSKKKKQQLLLQKENRDDDTQKNEGEEEEEGGKDEQARIVTGWGFPLEDADALAQARGDDYDEDVEEEVERSADAELADNKILTECFLQISVEDTVVATQNNPDNGLDASNESTHSAALSTDVTDAQNIKTKRSKSTSPRKKPPPPPPPPPKLSPYFPKPLPLVDASCLPFPPISAPSFGLVQEQLSHQPFRLLIATIFLNRTRGPVAIPVLFQLFAKYPTITAMADANHADIVGLIRNLGFQNQRATKFIALARTWLSNPPQKGRRYRKLHYPCRKDGADIGADEVVGQDDARVGWEIAHLPGVGAYAIDSWRIFCRDFLLADEAAPATQEEWKRVVPQDKELRAYLTWMWLKEGWLWDPETGHKTRADAGMMERAEKGGVAYEAPNGNWVLEALENNENNQNNVQVAVRRAGFSLDYS